MNKGLIQVDGKFYKQCKVVMLPTKKAIRNGIAELPLSGRRLVFLNKEVIFNNAISDTKRFKPQHLYILSDEEIKEGDWVFNKEYFENKQMMVVYKAVKIDEINHHLNKEIWYKIIASTDPELITSTKSNYIQFNTKVEETTIQSLPRPSNAFIKKYCHLGGINDIVVEYETIVTNPDEPKFFALYNEQIKVAPDNTITIKQIPQSWNKQEVETLLDKLINEEFIDFKDGVNGWDLFEEWKRKNL